MFALNLPMKGVCAIFVYCFSCRYLVQLGLRQLGLPAPEVSRSVPGFLAIGTIWSFGLKACIGAIQGLIGRFLIPFLASKATREKHVIMTVSNLIMNCFIPVVIIMYLDTRCLGRWVACLASRKRCDFENAETLRFFPAPRNRRDFCAFFSGNFSCDFALRDLKTQQFVCDCNF